MDPQHRSSCKRGSRQCFFEIANVRQACSLKTIFSTLHQASRYLRQNWNRIEQWRGIVSHANALKMAGSIWW